MSDFVLVLTVLVGLDLVSKLWRFQLSVRDIRMDDEALHFAYVRAIRNNRYRIPMVLNRRALMRSCRGKLYPFLVHWILSFFRDEWVRRNGGLISVCFEELYLILVGLSTYVMAGATLPESGLRIVAAALAMATVAINPQTVGRNPSSPMQYRLSARAAGTFFSSAACLSLVMVLYQPQLVGWLATSIILVALTALSSKFGLQVVVLTYVGMAAAILNPLPPLLVAGGLVAAAVVSFGRYWYVLRQHLRHLAGYRLLIKDVHPMTTGAYVASLENLRNFLRNPHANFALVFTSPLLRPLVFWLPQFAIVALGVLLRPSLVLPNGMAQLFLAWLSVDVLIWLLVLHPALKFVGEADRYLAFSGCVPLYSLAAVGVLNAAGPAGRVIGAAVLFAYPLLFYQVTSTHRESRVRLEGIQKEVRYLNELEPGVVLELPVQACYFFQACGVNRHWFIPGLLCMDATAWTELYDAYPVTDHKIDDLIQKYTVDYLVVMAGMRDKIKHHDLSKHQLLFEGQHLSIYAVEPSRLTSAQLDAIPEG